LGADRGLSERSCCVGRGLSERRLAPTLVRRGGRLAGLVRWKRVDGARSKRPFWRKWLSLRHN